MKKIKIVIKEFTCKDLQESSGFQRTSLIKLKLQVFKGRNID